ncbi:MAG: hypothetical protein IPP90_13320 [Gemmatimonadaceae bacterium]|nr:hypothetical protein [Gemmatimonadaceae bacterium]
MTDPQTNQVSLLATVPNAKNALVAGLFVEGRIAAEKRIGILVPEKAVDQTGIVPIVMRLGAARWNARGSAGGRARRGRGNAGDPFGTGDTVLLGAARGISIGSSTLVVSSPKDAPAAPVKNN